MVKRLTMLLAGLFFLGGVAFAQSQVSGTVTDENGDPVVGAAVRVAGTKTGTVTDVNGHFSISAPADSRLTVTYIGMQDKTVKAGNNLKITLSSSQKELDEVMVVAFGTEKKSQFTGSATVVGADELAKSQVTSVTNALAGSVPGVQLTSSNGAPGSTSTIRIRGFSSLNAGQDPLVIVDGAPYSGDIANINPADVENMTVLKDASAAALYGARGANGVIMITTKRAKSGDAKVTFDAKYGWNSRALQHYDTVNDPAAYYELQYAALNNYFKANGESANAAWQDANAALLGSTSAGGIGTNIWTIPNGEYLIGSNGRMNPNATLGRVVSYGGEDYLITPDDWEDVGTRTGHRQEYNLSVSGSNDRSNFYASLGYLDNEGITYNSNLRRFSGRLRGDYQVKSWLKVGANMSWAHYNNNSLADNGNSSSTGNIWAFSSQMAPIYPAYIRNADGSIKIDQNGIKMMDYGDGLNAGQTRPFIYNANALQDTKLNTHNSEGNFTSGNAFADITLYKGLKLTLNGTYNIDETRFTNVYNPYYGQFDSTGGTVEKEHGRTFDFDLQQLLNYTFTLAQKNNFTIMLGHEYYKARTYDLGASKSQMFSQKNKELNGAVVDGKASSSYKDTYNNEGYFGRLLYDYDGTYFGEFSLRRDASSRFAKDHRWGTFWSVGASWLISKEKWFNASWVDQLKLKASIGQQGNDNIGSYRYTDLYNITNSNGSVSTTFASKGTPDITWETNTNFNVGAEFNLFHNKLSGSLEYYYRKTTDMLFAFYVAPSLGYASYYDNVGDLSNQGFELTLDYNAISKKNFNWDVRFNISSLKSKITKLDQDKKTSVTYDADGNAHYGYTSGSFFITEDNMYTWRLKEYAGVSEDGQSQWYKNKYEQDENGDDIYYDENNQVVANPSTYAGVTHRKVTGREKTTTYSDADYYYTKKSTVPKFFGGFGTTLSFYGFDVSANFSFSLGGKQFDSGYQKFMAPPTNQNAGYNFHKDVYKAWSPENPSSNIPRWNWDDLYAASSSTRFLKSSSYLNIENINVGYTLPRSLTQKINIEQLRIYGAAENVAYFSARKGFDPRQSYTGATDPTNYSPMRTISMGIQLTF